MATKKSIARKELQRLEIIHEQLIGAALHASTQEIREERLKEAKEVNEKRKELLNKIVNNLF